MSNKNKIITAYTLQQCNSCKEQSKQKFSDGDYVFKEISHKNFWRISYPIVVTVTPV